MHEAGRGGIADDGSTEPSTARWRGLLVAATITVVGAVSGGIVGASFVVLVTQVIKLLLAVVSEQPLWVLVVAPLVGLTLSVLILHGLARGDAVQRLPVRRAGSRYRPYLAPSWYTFPRDVARADLTADVVSAAGREEEFPWRLAPVRTLAIVATVGLGAPMGTEAPAAHLGVAAGSWLGAHRRLTALARPAAVAGGAAGVAALMGIPLVGTAFILELGRRRRVALSWQRVTAALLGGAIGWAINVVFELDLIRLIVPQVAPDSVGSAVKAVLFVGVVAGSVTALTGAAIYTARGWKASPRRRLLLGGAAVALAAVAIAALATPGAAIGPGGGAVLWAETGEQAPWVLMAVALLRAAATTAAVAAGGCGGVFVPFLAIGDLSGRVFAPLLHIPGDLAGAAGAAAGIAGGYRLPVTATAMVLGLGGPLAAELTCLGTVAIATAAGLGANLMLDRLIRARAVKRA